MLHFNDDGWIRTTYNGFDHVYSIAIYSPMVKLLQQADRDHFG